MIPHGNLHVGAIRIAYLDLTILGVAAGAVALLGFILRRTRIGRALRASAADRDAARQMGIDVDAMQSVAFALSGALAGLAGVLVGMAYRNVEPSMAAAATINGFAAAALGGLGSPGGALAGGLILGVAERTLTRKRSQLRSVTSTRHGGPISRALRRFSFQILARTAEPNEQSSSDRRCSTPGGWNSGKMRERSSLDELLERTPFPRRGHRRLCVLVP